MGLLSLFAAVAGSNVLLELDDQSVFTDDGTAFVPSLETHPVDFGPAGGYGRLRELLQWVRPTATATLSATPVADDVPDTTQTYTVPLSVAQGRAQRVEAPFSAAGARFSLELTLRDLTGAVSLGEADLTYVDRRSKTGRGSR